MLKAPFPNGKTWAAEPESLHAAGSELLLSVAGLQGGIKYYYATRIQLPVISMQYQSTVYELMAAKCYLT